MSNDPHSAILVPVVIAIKNNIKRTLYISDLDGTLLNRGARLSEITVDAINRLIGQGMQFTYATARSFTSAGELTNKLKLKLPVATYNGAFLINPADGDIIEACVMDMKRIRGILVAIRDEQACPLVYSLIDGRERVSWICGRETDGIKNYLATRKNDKRLRPVADYERLYDGSLFYITIIGSRGEALSLQHFFEGNEHIYYHVQEDTYNKDEFWLEAFRYDATKEHAVKKLRQLANADEVVCFGDNINDLPMFRASDRCLAVSNANDELKKAAMYVIGSNNDDGVASWLENEWRDQL